VYASKGGLSIACSKLYIELFRFTQAQLLVTEHPYQLLQRTTSGLLSTIMKNLQPRHFIPFRGFIAQALCRFNCVWIYICTYRSF